MSKQNKKENPEIKTDLMNTDEAMQLMADIAIATQNEPFVLYGLFFLFATIERHLKANKPADVSDLASFCQNALYKETWNFFEGADRLAETINLVYRGVDFTKDDPTVSQNFVKAEFLANKGENEDE